MQLFSSWTGGDFLLFYIMLLALSVAAAWWLPAFLREPGRRGESDDIESIALLAGGRQRMTDSLLADLYVRGGLAPLDAGKLVVAEPNLSASPAGQALLSIASPLTLPDARRAIQAHSDRVAARLRRAGLLLRPEEHARIRWISVAPLAALFFVGVYRQRAGSALGEPTGFLVILLAMTAVLAVIRFVVTDPRTAAGVAAVKDLRARSQRFSRAPRSDEVAMAVALFGTGVLVGTPWEPVHAMRQPGNDGGGADGDSGGGSGCGGGGCGGCGG
ncbi:TIGR04222 domain-containing membrane protein [Erythrobacter sp. R86502]|uniref:TIGR04222 domain-containing membrane protein n=1 Tax=Erythrobacter sp. R86502 TaxID=3093846 RepID=UPI0036D28146